MQNKKVHALSKSGIFYRDRDEWMRYVTTREDLESSTRLVACYIALRINPQAQDTWPMQATIAKDMGVSAATVKRAVRKLVAENLLHVVASGQRGKRRATNRYSLIHPAQGIMGDPSARDHG